MEQSRERKWGSSGSANPRNRLRSALKKPLDPRPPSAIPRPPSALARPPSTRPDSRRSRPSSRMEPRPDSRLESNRSIPKQDLSRPKSGVRPLSGKVFMRRTADHGWVAKAYNVNGEANVGGVNSQSDLLLFDDFSDCDSLDSFFDDDFDVQTSEEKLGNLLSCNTLGVESKNNRQDWVSGKLGLPEFHCPRCRDHWYGLTDVPCDEELARLIREGLWKTGKEGGGKTGQSKHSRGRNQAKENTRDYKSHSDTTLSADSSTTRLARSGRRREVKGHWGSSTGEDGDKKKSKKRITFKLDDDTEGGGVDNTSNSGLDNYGGYRRAQGNKKFGEGLSNEDGRQIEALNGGHGNGDLKAPNGDNTTGGGGYTNGLAGNSSNERSGHKGSDSDGSGYSNGLGLGNLGDRNNSDSRKLDGLSNNNHPGPGLGSGSDGSGKGSKSLSGDPGQSAAGVTLYGGTTDGRANTNSTGLSNGGISGQESHSGAEQARSNGHTESAGGVNSVYTNSGPSHNTNDSGSNRRTKGDSSQNIGSSSQVKLSGSRRGSLSTEDHGRNVRRAGGYMRAVSPNSSDWGDPTHARPFISSTATSRTVSRCGSAVNLGRDSDEEKEGLTLPPIVPAIASKKPLLDLSDLMGGFEFTRAWTFSYHNN